MTRQEAHELAATLHPQNWPLVWVLESPAACRFFVLAIDPAGRMKAWYGPKDEVWLVERRKAP